MDMVKKKWTVGPHPHPASPNLKKTFEYAIYDLLKFDGDWGQVTTF